MCQLHISYKSLFGSLSKKLFFCSWNNPVFNVLKITWVKIVQTVAAKLNMYHSIYEVFENVLGLIYFENFKSRNLKLHFFTFSVTLFCLTF